jgi:hypothetical protein
MVHIFGDLQIKPWDLDLFAKAPLKLYWVKSEFQWYGLNFEAIYLPNYEDFSLGQHIKFVKLLKENNFAIGVKPWSHEEFGVKWAQSWAVRLP